MWSGVRVANEDCHLQPLSFPPWRESLVQEERWGREAEPGSENFTPRRPAQSDDLLAPVSRSIIMIDDWSAKVAPLCV